MFHITQIAEAVETSEKGVTEVVKTAGLVRVTIRNEGNSYLLSRNGVFQVVELAEPLETIEAGIAEVGKIPGLVRVTIRGEVNSCPLP